MKIIDTLRSIRQNESGATTVEYALLLALIAGALLFSLTALGNESGTFWGSTATSIDAIR